MLPVFRFFLLFVFLLFTTTANIGNPGPIVNGTLSISKNVRKLFLDEFKDLVRIPPSKYIFAYGTEMILTKFDHHALAAARPKERIDKTQQFFINTHELTNLEYRTFVEYHKQRMLEAGTYDTAKKDHPVWYSSSNGKIKNVNIEVNQNIWLTEFNHLMGDPMAEYYFPSSAFNHYPVVGISYAQCLAFIEWKNEQLTAKLKEIGYDGPWGAYKIPTREEWELAAGSRPNAQWLDENQTHKREYPWDGHSLQRHPNYAYMANFGRIIDQNGHLIKEYSDDGFQYTAPVKSFPANDYGLYDMAGNVSEWTSSTVSYDSLFRYYATFYELSRFQGDTFLYNEFNQPYPDWDKIQAVLSDEKYRNAQWINPNRQYSDMLLTDYIEFAKRQKPMETHNLALLRKFGTCQIVKGGDWHHGPVYLLLSSEQAYHKEEASATLGMRLALDLNPDLVALLWPEKSAKK